MGDWTFFSNHGHVFFCLARNGDARLRDVAADVGITERAVQKIVKDLQQAGYIEVRKQGRCNRYRINRRKSLRHPLESHCSVSKLVNLVTPGARAAAVSPAPAVEERTPVALTGGRSEAGSEPAVRPEPATEAEAGPDLPAVPLAPAAASSEEPLAVEAGAEDPTEAGAPENVREPSRDDERESGSKAEGKSEPIDIRQQGSLF